MSRYHIGTDRPSWWDYVVNTTESIGGSWPNLYYKVDYSFQWYAKTNGVSIAYNNSYYSFHTAQQKIATHIALNSGQYSGVVCSGTMDLPWTQNSRSVAHAPGTSVTSYASGSGVVNLSTLTIPVGSLVASLASYTHDSCTINVSYTSPYNYWYVRIWRTDGVLYKDNCSNGANTITGLTPGTNYTFNVELWGRDNGGAVVRSQISLMTNGFSYLKEDVVNTLENAITFNAYTYSDSFTTNITITYNGVTLCSMDKVSSSKVIEFTYTPTAVQLQTIYNSIPSALSCQGTIKLTTYINGVASGNTSYAITFSINQSTNKPVISSYDYADTTKAVDKTGNNTHILQNVSIVQVKNIFANAKNGASISRYRLSVDGTTFESTSTTIATNKIITSNSGIELIAIDSRGLQSTISKSFVKYIQYTEPVINEVVMSRTNDVEEGTRLTLKGTFDRLAINGLDKNIAIGIKYRYKKTDSSTWSGFITRDGNISGNIITYNNIIGNFDTGSSYDFEIVLNDYFNEVTNSQMLLKGKFELFIGDGRVDINGTLNYNDVEIPNVETITEYPSGFIDKIICLFKNKLTAYDVYIRNKANQVVTLQQMVDDGYVFSSGEQLTDQYWVDNKPFYRRTFAITMNPRVWEISKETYKMDIVFIMPESYVQNKSKTYRYKIDRVSVGGAEPSQNQIETLEYDGKFRITAGSVYETGMTGYITLKYTKTTD